MVDHDGMYVTNKGPVKESALELYTLLKPHLDEDNRLLVVFIPLNGAAGTTVLEADWLPWVLVDPTTIGTNPNVLMHEIGHACRLGHQQEDRPVSRTRQEAEAAKLIYRNVMMYGGGLCDQLHNWQVEAIHSSYWCNGSRPKNWYNASHKSCSSAGNCAFIWDE